MPEYENGPLVIIERHGGGTGAFLWGALVGAGVALLLAPRSGAETQAEIRDRALRLRDAADDRVTGARLAMTDAVDRTRGRVRDQVSSVRRVVETRADQARQAVEAGRRAARDARDELEQRVAAARSAVSSASDRSSGADTPNDDVDVVVIDVATDDAPDVLGER